MTGRPRTRLSREIAHRMIISLEHDGPATAPTLLARVGYLPDDIARHEARGSIHAPAIRMAIRYLVRQGPCALDPDGRLRYHEHGTPAVRAGKAA
jgi:hypothetical protein